MFSDSRVLSPILRSAASGTNFQLNFCSSNLNNPIILRIGIISTGLRPIGRSEELLGPTVS